MARRQNHHMPLSEIDLNRDIINSSDVRQQRISEIHSQEKSYVHLPDLNINPHSPREDIRLSNHLLLDLNEKPHLEDGVPEELRLQISEEANCITDEDGYEDNENSESLSTENGTTRVFLRNDKRIGICDMLLRKSVDGKLKKGVTTTVASSFSVPIRTVQRIWKQAKESETSADVFHKKTKNCGRKTVEIDLDRIRSVPLHSWTALRSLSCAIDISKTTLGIFNGKFRIRFGVFA